MAETCEFQRQNTCIPDNSQEQKRMLGESSNSSDFTNFLSYTGIFQNALKNDAKLLNQFKKAMGNGNPIDSKNLKQDLYNRLSAAFEAGYYYASDGTFKKAEAVPVDRPQAALQTHLQAKQKEALLKTNIPDPKLMKLPEAQRHEEIRRRVKAGESVVYTLQPEKNGNYSPNSEWYRVGMRHIFPPAHFSGAVFLLNGKEIQYDSEFERKNYTGDYVYIENKKRAELGKKSFTVQLKSLPQVSEKKDPESISTVINTQSLESDPWAHSDKQERHYRLRNLVLQGQEVGYEFQDKSEYNDTSLLSVFGPLPGTTFLVNEKRVVYDAEFVKKGKKGNYVYESANGERRYAALPNAPFTLKLEKSSPVKYLYPSQSIELDHRVLVDAVENGEIVSYEFRDKDEYNGTSLVSLFGKNPDQNFSFDINGELAILTEGEDGRLNYYYLHPDEIEDMKTNPTLATAYRRKPDKKYKRKKASLPNTRFTLSLASLPTSMQRKKYRQKVVQELAKNAPRDESVFMQWKRVFLQSHAQENSFREYEKGFDKKYGVSWVIGKETQLLYYGVPLSVQKLDVVLNVPYDQLTQQEKISLSQQIFMQYRLMKSFQKELQQNGYSEEDLNSLFDFSDLTQRTAANPRPPFLPHELRELAPFLYEDKGAHAEALFKWQINWFNETTGDTVEQTTANREEIAEDVMQIWRWKKYQFSDTSSFPKKPNVSQKSWDVFEAVQEFMKMVPETKDLQELPIAVRAAAPFLDNLNDPFLKKFHEDLREEKKPLYMKRPGNIFTHLRHVMVNGKELSLPQSLQRGEIEKQGINMFLVPILNRQGKQVGKIKYSPDQDTYETQNSGETQWRLHPSSKAFSSLGATLGEWSQVDRQEVNIDWENPVNNPHAPLYYNEILKTLESEYPNNFDQFVKRVDGNITFEIDPEKGRRVYFKNNVWIIDDDNPVEKSLIHRVQIPLSQGNSIGKYLNNKIKEWKEEE